MGPFDCEPLEQETSIESALERAAQTARIAQLMIKACRRPSDTEHEDDLDLIEHVLWANSLCLRRAIELHNASVPKPEDPPGVVRLRRKEAE
jgi:hypothetical protein